MGNRLSSSRRTKKKKEFSGSSKEKSDTISTSSSSSDSLYSNSTYFLRNNEEEFDRQQRTHFFAKYFFDGKNFSAPCTEILESGCKVLDIGCGSGAWVLDCATEFQKSFFVGVDISPIFPQSIKPYNATFVQADLLSGLPFESNSFDIVHLSNMGTCFTEEEWRDNVIPEVIRLTKPDGWFESQEFIFKKFDVGPCQTRILASVRSYMSELGINVDFVEQMKDFLTKNTETLADVQETVVRRSVGCGSKLGNAYTDFSMPALKFISSQLSRIMGITEDEYDNILEGFREEFKVYKNDIIYRRVFARKKMNE